MAKKNLAQAAQAATDHFFTGSVEDQSESVSKPSETAQEGRQADRTGESSSDETKAVRERKKTVAEPVKVFSFRAAVRDVDQWRLYASIRGEKVDEIGAAAMREYLKRHPLTGEEKALFDKRVESMKA